MFVTSYGARSFRLIVIMWKIPFLLYLGVISIIFCKYNENLHEDYRRITAKVRLSWIKYHALCPVIAPLGWHQLRGGRTLENLCTHSWISCKNLEKKIKIKNLDNIWKKKTLKNLKTLQKSWKLSFSFGKIFKKLEKFQKSWPYFEDLSKY